MIEREEEFWQGCLSGIAPMADGHPATKEALKLLYPDTDGNTIELTEGATKACYERLDLLTERKEINKNLKEVEAKLDARSNLIQVELGSATFGNLKDKSGHTVSWKKTVVPSRTQDGYEFRVLRHHKN